MMDMLNGFARTARIHGAAWFCAFAVCGVVSGAAAADAGKQPTEREKAVMRLTAAAAVLRTAAAETDGLDRALEKWGSETFKAKWKADVGALFEKEERIEWADFFSSAVVWLGGVERSYGVAGFYSPWADGVLLVLMEAGEKNTRLIDFAVVSGESLRGGAAKNMPPEASLSLYPAREPLIIALARLYGPASAAFAKLYPLEGGKAVLVPPMLAMRLDPPKEETLMVKARMLVRMKMFRDYLDKGNHDWVKAVAGVQAALRSGDEKTVSGVLSEKQDAVTMKTVCALPKDILAGLSPNYFIPVNGGALVGFVNPNAPRWLVSATLQGGPQDKRIARIELLDMDLSDKAVELWDKEASK